MIKLLFCLALATATVVAQEAPSGQISVTPTDKQHVSTSDISQLRAKADAGDMSAQVDLGKAYQDGNGVPQDDGMAVHWFRKAAEQGSATAENNLGIMCSMGQGVSRDKEEAVRWYHKAAKQGNGAAMFNLGAAYYNGEGVESNVSTAYAWFLLAKEVGEPSASDAVRRTADEISPAESADAEMQIGTMYEKGDELPANEEQAVRWLRSAAETDSRAKVLLAGRIVNGPDAEHNYGQAFDLCKQAAKNYAPGQYCVGVMYRRGMGVNKDAAEALKWFEQAARGYNPGATKALGEMYSKGEGTKVDRLLAFRYLLRATRMHANGAKEEASDVLRQMNESELRKIRRELRQQSLDPKKVFADLGFSPPS
jgi:TPR repeat protein